MEQNGQNVYSHTAPQHSSYAPTTYNYHHPAGAFNPGHEEAIRLEGSSPLEPHGYTPPSAPPPATQDFPTAYSTEGLDYSKPKEERDACSIVTVTAIDPTIKTDTDNFVQVLEGVSKRLSHLETIVQGLECSIEGLKHAEREKHDESNNRLTRLELLIKEVHTGVQLLHENQKLDGALSQWRKLHIVDDQAPIGGTPPVSRWQQQPKEAVEPSETSEEPTRHVPTQSLSRLPSHHPDTPPHNMPASPSMNESGKPPAQQPYFPPPHQHPPGPLSTGQPLPPQHSMQAPSFSYQAQGQPPAPVPAPTPQLPLPPPPPQGLYNLPVEATLYGHMQSHQQHLVPPMPVSSGYVPNLPQYPAPMYGEGARQHLVPEEVQHSSQQYGPSGTEMYEPVGGRAGATPFFVPPYVQSLQQSSPPVSMYETTSGIGYGTPPYKADQRSGGGGNHSRAPTPQLSQATLYAGSASTSRPQVDEVTERVVAMGFQREQVRTVVRGLMDIGQHVDMNAVLDKLMNGGASPQPPRGWHGR